MKNYLYQKTNLTFPTQQKMGSTGYKLLTTFLILLFSISISVAQTVQTITANGTFTVPAGVTSLKVEVWGTGGSGGGATGTVTAIRGGGGGGGGAYTISTVAVTPGQLFTATIGALGSTGTGAGGPGGASTFISGATNVTANGGAGGAPTNGVGGAGGIGTLNGGTGGTGNASNGAGGGGGAGNLTAGSNGATTALGVGGTGSPNVAPYTGGNGGAHKNSNGNGNAGSIPGGGGGGGRGAAFFGTANGGAGARGQIVLTYTAPVCPMSTSVSPLADQSGCAGFSASTLTASVATSGTVGSPTIQYQWYYNITESNTVAGATLIAGATSSTYLPLTTISASGTRYYFCVAYAVNNGCGQTNASQNLASPTVSVSVNTPLPPTVAPASQTICNGDIVTLTAAATATNLSSNNTSILGAGGTTSTATSTAAALGPNPFQNYYGGTKQQMLITAAELNALGFTANGASISAIGVYLANIGGPALQNVIIKMQNTNLTALTTTPVTLDWTTVFTVASYTQVVGLNNFTLSSAFDWTGNNLLVEINYTNDSAPSTGTNRATYDNTSYVSTWFYRVDDETSAVLDSYSGAASFIYSSRNRLRFIYKNVIKAPVWTATTASLYSNSIATIPYVTGTPAATVYAKPSANTTYTATATYFGTCPNTSTSILTVNQQPSFTACPSNQVLQTGTGICTRVVNYTATVSGTPSPTVTYIFTGATTGSGSGTGSGATFNKGLTTVTINASNGCTPNANCTFTITINDVELPVINCPSPISVNSDPGNCGATILSLGTPVTSDNCGIASVNNNHPSTTYLPGITAVTWTATDVNGNIATCIQNITVTDIQLPTVMCPADITISTDAGLCTSTSSIGTATANDNCSVSSIVSSPAGPYAIGSTTVTWTATDASGNIATCTQIVTVNDTENPTISCPANVTVSADAGLCTASAVALGTATGSDNCGTPVFTNDAPATFPIGTTTVTWTATDGAGNIATCTQTVTVTEDVDPLISCPADVTVSADAGLCTASAVALGTATGSDNCSVPDFTNDAPVTFPIGTTTVTWTATDASGNIATCTQIVTVNDTENPTISCPANVTVSADAGLCTASEVALGTPSGSDNCGTPIYTNDAPATFPIGTTTVTWTATDGAGNIATCTQTVTVNDTENPTITCPANVTVSADAGLCTASAVALGTATGSDNCGTPVFTNDAPVTFTAGTTTVTWTATDASGNIATCTQTVTVNDTENPVATCQNINVELDVNHTYTVTAAEINNGSTDNCGIASITIQSGQTTYTCADEGQTFPVTILVTDVNGNTATCSGSVTVNDNINPCCEIPVITCPSNIVVSNDNGICGAMVTFSATSTGTSPVITYSQNSGTLFPIGTTTVTANATNDCGTDMCTFTVTVNDTENPQITCPATANIVTDLGMCTSSASIGTATGTDNCGIPVITLSPAGPYGLGSTTVTWTAADANGNIATCTQVVIVTDGENPIITCPADVTTCSTTPSLGSPITSDNCGTVTTSNDAPGVFSLGSTIVTWTADDGNGNTATCTQTVTVNSSPTATISGSSTICSGQNAILTINFTGTAPWDYTYSDGTTTFGPFTTSSNPELVTVSPAATVTFTMVAVSDAYCQGTGSGSATINVDNAPPVNSLTITSSPLSGCVGNVFTITANNVISATGYTWSVPAGTLINGQPGPVTTTVPTVNITLGTLAANSSGWQICAFAFNACGQTNTNCKFIRGALSMPAAISGSNIACASSSGTYSTLPVSGATSYLWTGTNGITFSGSGTSITANFPAGFVNGTICVAGQLPCGYNGPQRCYSISNTIPVLGAMSGTFAICPGQSGQVFSVPPANGASTYNWTVPSGVNITSGLGTNSITVSVNVGFSTGSICVTTTSLCGTVSAPRCKTISSTLPGVPGNVVGQITGVCGQTMTYSVPAVSGVISYNWSAPAGATISSPNGSNSIEITYPSNFTTGQLCVSAVNGCGSSASRCVIIKGVPNTPVVINGPSSVCSGDQGLSYSIAPVSGAAGYVWTVPTGATIVAGQNTTSIIVDWGTASGTIGITLNNLCGASGTRTLNVIVSCRISASSIPGASVTAFPNPVSSELSISVTTEKSAQFNVTLLDLSGRTISTESLNINEGEYLHKMDVSNLAKGIYMLSITNNDGYMQQIRIAVE